MFAHGWWTKDGEKMSKSVGNVLDPLALVRQYGLDNLRYFLVAEVPFGQDGDFSDEAFAGRVNSDLCNDIGNLAQRVLVMVDKHCEGRIPQPGPLADDDRQLLEAATEALAACRRHVEVQNMRAMCESIVGVAKLGNRYIDAQAPWTLRKTDPARMLTVLYVLADVLRKIAILLDPITPASSAALLDQLGATGEFREFSSFAALLPPGTKIGTVQPLFPKVEKAERAEGVANGSEQSAATAAADAAAAAALAALSIDELSAEISLTGGAIRDMKKDKERFGKAEVLEGVARLNRLKAAYLAKAGAEWVAK